MNTLKHPSIEMPIAVFTTLCTVNGNIKALRHQMTTASYSATLQVITGPSNRDNVPTPSNLNS